MHRQPQPKAQAKILRGLFAQHGIAIAHRQALDHVASLNGFSDWHVMNRTLASRPSQASSTAAPASKLWQCRFEAIGYVEDRETLEALTETLTDQHEVWEQLAVEAAELGFPRLVSASIEPDDAQDDTDIKVFVSITLEGHTATRENESPSQMVCDVLDQLAEVVSCDESGENRVNAQDWQLVEIDRN